MKKFDSSWIPPSMEFGAFILGDMPGDMVRIEASHIKQANILFPFVLEYLSSLKSEKIVLSVFGGSGVGKSEIGSILATYCIDSGYPTYLMSGDNYPRRCPIQNDAERLNRFRSEGLAAIALEENFSESAVSQILAKWPRMADFELVQGGENPYLSIYQNSGRAALKKYLGTEEEINYSLVNSILHRFKSGFKKIPLKRMGRTESDVFFEEVDFSDTKILVLEWTHGNNALLQGVDFPIYLYSSPKDTLKHRKKRSRDAGTDSCFTQLILEIEQAKLNAQASKAAIIIGKDGTIISVSDFIESLT